MSNKNNLPIAYKSPFDQAKYNFTRRLAIYTATILFLLSIFYFVQQDFFFYPVIAGSIFATITYFIVTKTGNIKLAGIFAIASIDVIIITKLFIVSHFHYYEDFFWIMCITIFAFFVLGRAWGIATLIFNMVFTYCVFFLVRHDLITLIDRPFTSMDEINFALNLIIGTSIFITIVLELLKQNRIAEANYLSTHLELEIQNEEKTVMLREIHHRVKNNLQIITSLLRLQSSEIKDPLVISEFTEAINRISAIAKIHDKMYNNKSLNKIDLKDYLEDLVDDIIQSNTGIKVIKREIYSTIQFIRPKELVPVALIFNELVTNSIKHAFVHQEEGLIEINATISPENEIKITYSDNGTWIDRFDDTSRIGMDLIESFVDQLDGKITLKKSPRTEYCIEFTSRD